MKKRPGLKAELAVVMGRFRLQKPTDRFPSTLRFIIENLFTCCNLEKMNEKMGPGLGPALKRIKSRRLRKTLIVPRQCLLALNYHLRHVRLISPLIVACSGCAGTKQL